jgi:hypothetical protein
MESFSYTDAHSIIRPLCPGKLEAGVVAKIKSSTAEILENTEPAGTQILWIEEQAQLATLTSAVYQREVPAALGALILVSGYQNRNGKWMPFSLFCEPNLRENLIFTVNAHKLTAFFRLIYPNFSPMKNVRNYFGLEEGVLPMSIVLIGKLDMLSNHVLTPDDVKELQSREHKDVWMD